MTLSGITKDRILTEILQGESAAKADTKEEKEFRESLITENAKVFTALEQAEAQYAVVQLWLREKSKSEGASDAEIEKELPLSYSDERMEKFKKIFKEMEDERADIKKSK